MAEQMKILIAVDGSTFSRMAIEFIASRDTLIRSNPDIQILNVRWPLPAHPARIVGLPVVREYYGDEAGKILRPARKRLQKAGLNPTVRFAVGPAASEISTAADKDNVDLLVLGSHGHSALGGLLLGSVTNEVLARTKRAMLIVRGKAKRYTDSLRVGIAVDGSRYGLQALRYVLKHPDLFGVNPRLTVIHVVQDYALNALPVAEAIPLPAFSESEVRAFQNKAYEDAMKSARSLLRKDGVNADEVRLIGNAGDELSAYGNKSLDLLVLGSHGYGAFKAAIMGSVATRVTARCKMPLLLVR
jgi:nucleotide-binding universal stress UspA family protein